MKKPENVQSVQNRAPQKAASAVRAFWRRLCAPVSRLGIRSRVFGYFLIFTAALLTLLWVFQIALLPDFYRLQKTQALTATMDTLTGNIDNSSLQLLADRIAQSSDICVLVVNDQGEKLISAEASRECMIHRMNGMDLRRYIQLVEQESKGTTLYRIFSMGGFGKSNYDANRFSGHVPQADRGMGQSMAAIRAAQTENGEMRYVFLNVIITPVDATVQTLQSQFWFIAALMVLLSFFISLVLSRRIARPIIATNEAAKGLPEGMFEPETTSVSYLEIDQLNATLIQAAKDLRRVEEMQRELIANISHDLRTPLTLIQGYAEAMRDLPGENTPDNMQVIIEEAKRLTSLVNAVLEYSAGKNGKNPVEPKPYQLTESILQIMNRYRKLTEQDGYQILFQYSQTVTVLADEMKIGQVIYNLINNALTYTGADKTVTVVQTVAHGNVRIEVKDTGEGIDEQELPYIWSRYYRGHKPHKRPAVGTGLGLSIVRTILDNHHVQYGVQSAQGVGTTFWFELKAEKVEAITQVQP